ncbi:MAG: hypothetical protein L6416_03685 [Candidatus Omnitrophica bacterium]|nr:hypothetical protein [Candidatus Omnitrophota bacterium]
MNNNSEFKPNDDEKRLALDHVLYEIEMFTALPIESASKLISNAIIESYLVHARVLCDFFQNSNRIKDDILCSDYGFTASTLTIPEDIETRFDKCLAHLTYSRLKYKGDTKTWIYAKFRPHINERIKTFLLHLLNKKKDWLNEKVIIKCEYILKNI